MATTKAFELAQLSALTGVTAADTTLSDEFILDSGSLTLDGGRNIQWGGVYASGFPTIWGHSTNKQIKFAPDGTTSGLLYQMTATQLEVNPTTTSTTSTSGALVVAGGAGIAENLNVGGITNVSDTTTSTTSTSGALVVAGGAGIAENLNVGGNVIVTGNLTVEGTQVTLNTSALDVEDKNITLNYHASNDTSASADGAGITIQDAVDASNDASILWDATNDKFTISHGLTLLSANHLQFTRGGELRSTDTGGTIRTLVRVNGTNELEYGWSGAGPVKFMGGGSYAEKIRIHTDGNVGIGGVTAPVTALHVDPGYVTLGGSGGTDNSWINNVEDGNLELVNEGRSTNEGAVRINRKNNPAGDTTYFRDTIIYDGKSNVVLFVDGSEGKVGIGTDSPNALLDLEGVTASSSPILRFTGTGNASQGDVVGQIEFYNSDATDNTAGIMGKIRAIAGPSGGEGSLQFLVDMPSEGADANKVALHLNANSWVGIGTDAPASRLHISGNSDVSDEDCMLIIEDVDGSAGSRIPAIVFRSNTGGTVTNQARIRGTDTQGIVMSGSAALGDDLVVQAGGVGIGTTSPDALLHISDTSPHIDVGPHGGNRAKFGYHNLDVIIGSSSSTGSIIFKNNIGSTDSPQTSGDQKMIITDTGVGIGTTSPAHKLDVDGAIGASQVRHSILPSLHLDFASSKHLDSRITFYRDSVGSYIDSTGVLRYASPNEPRFDHDISTKRSKGLLIEEQRENLLYYSSVIGDLDFASGWQNSGSNPIRQNAYAAVAPDGTATATLISNLNNTNTDPDLYIYQSHNLNGGELITYSIWVKAYTSANVGKHVEIRGKRIGGTSASFGKVATLTSEWQRVEVSCQYNADNTSTARLYVGARSNYGNFTDDDGNTVSFDPASEALFWGAQAEEGAFATSYIPTRLTDSSRSSTATYQDKDGVLRYAGKNEPRYGYKWDGQKYAPVGLLVEPSVQQIAPQTETIGSAWYTTAYSKQDVRITLPNGTVGNAIKAIMDSGQSANAGTALGFYIGAFTRQTGLVYNTSFFAKSNDENGLRIRDGLRTGAFLDINLNNGEIVANNASVFYDVMVEKYAHGWWRISYNYDSTSSGTGGWHAIRSYNNGDGSKGFLFWGAQLTTASYTQYNGLSSYIPNPGGGWGVVTRTADVPNGAPTTRYKDVAHLDDILYADWNNEEEGTFYTEYEVPYDIEDISINYRVLERHTEGTGQNVTSILLNSGTDQTNAGAYNNSAWQSLLGVTNSLGVTDKNVVNKLAFGFKDNDFGLSIQGSPIAQDSSGTVTRGATRLQLGSNSSLANTLNGHLKIVKFYPERLTNAELVALTENN